MKKICQIYVPQYFRSYGADAINVILEELPRIQSAGFKGICLIDPWVIDEFMGTIDYVLDQRYGTEYELNSLIEMTKFYGLEIGCSVSPKSVSRYNELVQEYFKGNPRYADVIYTTSEGDADFRQKISIFSLAEYAYTPIKMYDEAIWVRTFFTDGQIDLNWGSKIVREYFGRIFARIQLMGFDFALVAQAEFLFDDPDKILLEGVLTYNDVESSIGRLCAVTGGMKIFLECSEPVFALNAIHSFRKKRVTSASKHACHTKNYFVVDYSFLDDGGFQHLEPFLQYLRNFAGVDNYTPILGGHKQMPFANRYYEKLLNDYADMEIFSPPKCSSACMVGGSYDPAKLHCCYCASGLSSVSIKDIYAACNNAFGFKYLFSDWATEKGFYNLNSTPSEEDVYYNVSLTDENRSWQGRFPVDQLLG